jgi:hypothetical protein
MTRLAVGVGWEAGACCRLNPNGDGGSALAHVK